MVGIRTSKTKDKISRETIKVKLQFVRDPSIHPKKHIKVDPPPKTTATHEQNVAQAVERVAERIYKHKKIPADRAKSKAAECARRVERSKER